MESCYPWGKGIKMKKINLVFVSSPYASIKCKERDRNYYAKQLALEACHQVRLNGYEPLSPVLAFMDIYSEFERYKVCLLYTSPSPRDS